MKKENLKIHEKVFVKTALYTGYATITSVPRPWGGSVLKNLSHCPHGYKNEWFVGVETMKPFVDRDGHARNILAVCCHQITPIAVVQKPKTNDSITKKKEAPKSESSPENIWGEFPGGRELI